jgi:hypothetical protein
MKYKQLQRAERRISGQFGSTQTRFSRQFEPSQAYLLDNSAALDTELVDNLKTVLFMKNRVPQRLIIVCGKPI